MGNMFLANCNPGHKSSAWLAGCKIRTCKTSVPQLECPNVMQAAVRLQIRCKKVSRMHSCFQVKTVKTVVSLHMKQQQVLSQGCGAKCLLNVRFCHI